MKAIILAAGFGNRMKPLTNDLHKTLLTINEKTIIQRIVDGLIENDVTDIIIGTGYKAEELKQHLESTYRDKCKFTYVHNERYRETNNIFSLSLIFEQVEIDKNILLIESDLIYESDVIKLAINSPHENVALVDKYRNGMDGTVVSLSERKVSSVIPPHLQGSNFDFSDKYKTLNIYKFSKDFCNTVFKKILTYYSRTIDDNCYYELILGLIIYMQRESIHTEVVEGLLWTEVDDPNDLRLAEYMFGKNKQTNLLEKSWGGLWSYPITDFCFIRNMYFPSPSVISELKNNFENLIHNYGSTQKLLNQKLAYFTLLPEDDVFLLNGAAQIYPILKNFFSKSKALLPSPSFGEYPKTFPNHCLYQDDPDNPSCDYETEIAKESPDIVVIVNPNNPTGREFNTEKIYNSIKRNRNIFYIIDESFIDFSNEKSIEEFLTNDDTNVCVIKSLSKTLGVPGVRIGYLYTKNENLKLEINQSLPIWNANSIAEFFMEIILKHRNTIKYSYEQTKDDREHFIKKLKTANIIKEVYPSGANFILAKLNCTPSQIRSIVDKLVTEDKIFIKDISSKFPGELAHIRLAVRSPEENLFLVEKFSTL